MIAHDLLNGAMSEDVKIIIIDIKKLGEAKLKFNSNVTKVYYDSFDVKSKFKLAIPSGLNYFVSINNDVLENNGVLF